MCCWLPEQRELGKPVNTWCQHCAIGKGCNIYKDRPQGCKDFECLWLKNPAIPYEFRPDKIGVIFEPLISSRTCLALTGDMSTLSNNGVRNIITNLLDHGVGVIVTCPGHKPIVLNPKDVTVKQVWDNVVKEAALR